MNRTGLFLFIAVVIVAIAGYYFLVMKPKQDAAATDPAAIAAPEGTPAEGTAPAEGAPVDPAAAPAEGAPVDPAAAPAEGTAPAADPAAAPADPAAAPADPAAPATPPAQ